MSLHIDLGDLRKQLKRARGNYWCSLFTLHLEDWRVYASQIKKLKFDIAYWEKLINQADPL
ncbi:MAG: hypothetical protein NTU97_03185 [Candidatus Magasanikbacteria bacterium]|nr:hypothetical protein [Candidatus Magasanikbacteria bacterium]